MPLYKIVPAQPPAPAIESVSDDGEVRVRLQTGERTVLWIPLEQVEQLRRAVFALHREHSRLRWEQDRA